MEGVHMGNREYYLYKLTRAMTLGDEVDAYWWTRLLVQECCPKKY